MIHIMPTAKHVIRENIWENTKTNYNYLWIYIFLLGIGTLRFYFVILSKEIQTWTDKVFFNWVTEKIINLTFSCFSFIRQVYILSAIYVLLDSGQYIKPYQLCLTFDARAFFLH